jgi:hypothetical protein
MLKVLIERAGKGDIRLAPFIGIGCPGIIEADGTIDRGAQNLPGNWDSKTFNLPFSVHEAVPMTPQGGRPCGRPIGSLPV